MTINVTLCTLMINSLLCWTESTITCLPCDFCLSGTKPKDLNTHPPTLAANTSLSLSLSLFLFVGMEPATESRGKREISWDVAIVKVFESHRVSTPFLLQHFPLFFLGTNMHKQRERDTPAV